MRNRVTLRRFDVIRTATVAAVLYAVTVLVIGLIFVVPFILLAGAAGISSGRSDIAAGVAGAGIIGAMLLLVLGALFYAVVGWVMTAIACVFYNFVAGRVGGIRMEVDIEMPYGAPGYGAPGYGAPAWPAPASQGPPMAPPAGWGQPGG